MTIDGKVALKGSGIYYMSSDEFATMSYAAKHVVTI